MAYDGVMPLYRYCGPADLDWLVASACFAYGSVVKDPAGTRAWMREQLVNPDIVFVRSRQSVVVATVTRRFYDPNKVFASVAFIWSARPSAGIIHAIRGAKEWAKCRGAKRLQFHAGPHIKTAALAKRLGAVVDFTTYTLEL
jgi:hypothetical protein